MGIFSKKQQPVYEQPLSDEERTEALRANAIEYIVSLPKGDKDRFFEAVDLIWAGYNKLDRVKTVDERQTEKEAKALGMTTDEADDLGFDLLEDELPKANPLVTPPKTDAKKVEVK